MFVNSFEKVFYFFCFPRINGRFRYKNARKAALDVNDISLMRYDILVCLVWYTCSASVIYLPGKYRIISVLHTRSVYHLRSRYHTKGYHPFQRNGYNWKKLRFGCQWYISHEIWYTRDRVWYTCSASVIYLPGKYRIISVLFIREAYIICAADIIASAISPVPTGTDIIEKTQNWFWVFSRSGLRVSEQKRLSIVFVTRSQQSKEKTSRVTAGEVFDYATWRESEWCEVNKARKKQAE